ncbi:potassium-transporting ATPase subunit F [Homoserinibacter sp. YIM 151385]|nr:potassium-transporting ATPase subunit F [Homoserinibacter sp. YIM 151385]WBU37134.1 potassium-transporting ATPase subunit F [Homoserinibacter sp. YIM 151385]
MIAFELIAAVLAVAAIVYVVIALVLPEKLG